MKCLKEAPYLVHSHLSSLVSLGLPLLWATVFTKPLLEDQDQVVKACVWTTMPLPAWPCLHPSWVYPRSVWGEDSPYWLGPYGTARPEAQVWGTSEDRWGIGCQEHRNCLLETFLIPSQGPWAVTIVRTQERNGKRQWNGEIVAMAYCLWTQLPLNGKWGFGLASP